MPPDTLAAVQDHGHIALTLDRDLQDARRVFIDLAEAGIDYDDVTTTLEREGVKKFADSFDELFERVETKRDELAATHS
jgi:transaldolase